MEVRSDFAEPALVKTGALNWTPSPMAGVDRRMLDRIGDEVARATSIVRYAEGSAFPEHTHSGGEEFIVLEGVFQDEHGDYPAGTYVRNPVGTHHIPRSEPGCTIFVKLWQFDPEDQVQLAIDLDSQPLEADFANPAVRRAVLAERSYEQVALEEWNLGTNVVLNEPNGFEILILGGAVTLDGEIYLKNDWIRWPADTEAHFSTDEDGARLWIKRGHLSQIRAPGQS